MSTSHANNDGDRDDATPHETRKEAARRRLFQQRIASPANRRLGEIVAMLEEVADAARDFADDHGEKCRCGLCKHFALSGDGESIGDIIEHLRGIAWACDQGVSFLCPQIISRDEPQPECEPCHVRS